MKKIIFLDIDGVLAVPSSKYCLDWEMMKLLGEILNRTGAWIVVSSSWRASTIKETIFNLTNPDGPAVGSNPGEISGNPEQIRKFLKTCLYCFFLAAEDYIFVPS